MFQGSAPSDSPACSCAGKAHSTLMSSSWQGTRGHLVNSPEAARNCPRCNAAASCCCLTVRPCWSCAGSMLLGMSPHRSVQPPLCSKQPSEASGEVISLFKNRKGVCMSKKLGLRAKQYTVNRELLLCAGSISEGGGEPCSQGPSVLCWEPTERLRSVFL